MLGGPPLHTEPEQARPPHVRFSSLQFVLSQSPSLLHGQFAFEPPLQKLGPRQLLLAQSLLPEQDSPSRFLQPPLPQMVPLGQLERLSWQVPFEQVSGRSRVVPEQVFELLPQATPLRFICRQLRWPPLHSVRKILHSSSVPQGMFGTQSSVYEQVPPLHAAV